MKLPVAEAAFARSFRVTLLCLWIPKAPNLNLLIKHFLSTYCAPGTVPGIQ